MALTFLLTIWKKKNSFPLTSGREALSSAFSNTWIPRRTHLAEALYFYFATRHEASEMFEAEGGLPGWRWRRKGTGRCHLAYRSTPGPIPHRALVLASECPMQVLSCKGLFVQPLRDTTCLSVCSCCPAGEVRKREEPCWGTLSTTTNAAATSLFCRVEGREDPWDRAHPSLTPVLGFGRRGERNGLALTPVLRGARRLHLIASPLDNYKQAWALSNRGPTSPFLLGNNK